MLTVYSQTRRARPSEDHGPLIVGMSLLKKDLQVNITVATASGIRGTRTDTQAFPSCSLCRSSGSALADGPNVDDLLLNLCDQISSSVDLTSAKAHTAFVTCVWDQRITRRGSVVTNSHVISLAMEGRPRRLRPHPRPVWRSNHTKIQV